MSNNNWLGFEKLAEKIFSELHPYATVKHNHKILGKLSGIERQIDVSISAEVDGKEILVVIDTKNWSSPADINAVSRFAALVEDVEATKGYLICRAGFSKTVEQYANAKGIELLNLHDAQSKAWNLEIKFPILWVDYIPGVLFNVSVFLEAGDTLLEKSNGFYILSPDKGQTVMNVLATFEQLWNANEIPRSVGQTHYLRDERAVSILVLKANGERVWQPVENFALAYEVQSKTWLSYLTPDECRGIFDYKTDEFLPTFIGAEIPKKLDDNWVPIENPDELAITCKGILFTTSGYNVLEPGTGKAYGHEFHKLD